MSAEWISVNDRLPEPYTDVLVAYAGASGKLYAGVSYVVEDGTWDIYPWTPVHYWMPLPKLPND